MKTAYWDVRKGYPLADCEGAWKKYGVWNTWTWILYLGFLPFIFAVTSFFDWLQRVANTPEPLFIFALFLYIVAMMLVTTARARFRCPRCGARFTPFLLRGILGSGLSRECYNCGLRKWECPAALEDDSDSGGIVIRPRH
jgi:hypothetical protein